MTATRFSRNYCKSCAETILHENGRCIHCGLALHLSVPPARPDCWHKAVGKGVELPRRQRGVR